MKKISTIIGLISFVLLIASCSDDPVSDPNPIDDGNGVIYGTCRLLYLNVSPHPKSIDNSGIKVEIVNTNLSTFANFNGEWYIENVPSGTFTIKYSRDGFFSREISGVVSNGVDSTFCTFKTLDSNGIIVEKGQLIYETPPSISSTVLNNTVNLKIDSIEIGENGTTFRYDTTLIWTPELKITLNHVNSWVVDSLNIGFIGFISSNPNYSHSMLPDEMDTNTTSIPNFLWKHSYNNCFGLPVKQSSRNFSLNDLVNFDDYVEYKNINIFAKPNLYLHIVPYTYYLYYNVTYSQYDPPSTNPKRIKSLGSVYTAQIQYNW